ncbi:hypothetical protein V6N12_020872 [Hibiscus sabdariffa]|uniref:Uncharacterized protein n=1 Tax=Hibiscus sabdariffa TaxID=183260 RepID=A0ABR2CZD9_9ROSI
MSSIEQSMTAVPHRTALSSIRLKVLFLGNASCEAKLFEVLRADALWPLLVVETWMKLQKMAMELVRRCANKFPSNDVVEDRMTNG